MIVPGGGIAPDGSRWISSRPTFLLPVRVLGKLFRRLFLDQAGRAAHDAGRLAFFGGTPHLADRQAFTAAPGAAAEEALGRLRQAALRRAGSGARLSVALHPPRRHLQQPPHRASTRAASPSATRTTVAAAPIGSRS